MQILNEAVACGSWLQNGAAAGQEVSCSTVYEAKEEFWDRWVHEIFPSLLKQMKWYKYKRDARVGNVVLQRDETAVS
jgi:hypothetical protein